VPFQADNPNRNRNFVILVIAGISAFALVMGSYVALSLAGEDTDAFLRFLTIVIVTLIPSALAALRANSAAQNSQQAVDKVNLVAESVSHVEDKLNGTLDDRVQEASKQGAKQAMREGRSGRPTV
jgi:magnesium-transporting ATPase (P-type)